MGLILGLGRSECHGATKPKHHSYWTCALSWWTPTTEPMGHHYWSPHTLEPTRHKRSHCQRPVRCNSRVAPAHPCSPRKEKSLHSNKDPARPKINTYIFLKVFWGKKKEVKVRGVFVILSQKLPIHNFFPLGLTMNMQPYICSWLFLTFENTIFSH